ncbi:Transcriptional activator protein CopR [Planctomycetes bacterium LzC2]|uniref:Transcriptional activator protein CopR n=1 Tax=Alienimonas chondri TaxID=2681879 RepID=A0ABX1VJ03_9PLAN|nr:Transcriptional activator protein CopR [Alienimonas chondri]
MSGLRALLAEDTPDTSRLLRFFLEKAGANVEAVADGQAALDRLLPTVAGRNDGMNEAPTENGFDMVLMDMQMPVLDGYAATRALRAAGYDRPVVALTAHAMRGDAEQCLAAGCDRYAVKPISRNALVELILDAVRSETTLPPAILFN